MIFVLFSLIYEFSVKSLLPFRFLRILVVALYGLLIALLKEIIRFSNVLVLDSAITK